MQVVAVPTSPLLLLMRIHADALVTTCDSQFFCLLRESCRVVVRRSAATVATAAE